MSRLSNIFFIIALVIGIDGAFACVNSNCTECDTGMMYTRECCKDSSETDCIKTHSNCGKNDAINYPKNSYHDYCCNETLTLCTDVRACPKCSSSGEKTNKRLRK